MTELSFDVKVETIMISYSCEPLLSYSTMFVKYEIVVGKGCGTQLQELSLLITYLVSFLNFLKMYFQLKFEKYDYTQLGTKTIESKMKMKLLQFQPNRHFLHFNCNILLSSVNCCEIFLRLLTLFDGFFMA